MRIIYFGNWNIGYLALKKIIEAESAEIVAVVTNFDLSDSDKYRNRVYDFTTENNITVFRSYRDTLGMIKEDIIGISVAYGNEIFKEDILEKMKIYNFHPSYLPYHKGPSPILWQIKEGEESLGMSCHLVVKSIDAGAIVKRDFADIDYKKTYEENLEDFNKKFSDFICDTVDELVSCVDVKTIENNSLYYEHRLVISNRLHKEPLLKVKEYLGRKRILVFIGNRAELGILFSVIVELSNIYYVDVLVEGKTFHNEREDLKNKTKYLEENGLTVCLHTTKAAKDDESYNYSLSSIYDNTLRYINNQKDYDYAVVLGDRIEALGFSLAAFYSKIPILHFAGGDVANVPFFDTNIRHVITKLASLHFTFNEDSKAVVLQLGEEKEKVFNIGNPVFDYDRMGLLSNKNSIIKKYALNDGCCVIFTYHAGPFKSDEDNLKEFKTALQGVVESKIEKIIVTRSNSDPGSKEILKYIDSLKNNFRLQVVNSLGTQDLDGILKEFKAIVVGNSSFGLLETAFFETPTIDVGDRQISRPAGNNVTRLPVDKEIIREKINEYIDNYDGIKNGFLFDKYKFGDGKAALKVVETLQTFDNILRDDIIVKQFNKIICK